VLAVTGDGSFLMHSQEIETAVREQLPLTVLVWEDSGYGLIEWKMRLETGKVSNVRFTNPEITQYAASFGATGYHVTQAADLLPTLRKALDDDGVSIVVAPVDYAENINLTDHLGALTDPL
jgi:acetolactate synthase-1/2/3 large subunit